MSLDKAIKHGKEHRRPYYGTKAADPWCRNHGRCWICKHSRMHKERIMEEEVKHMKKVSYYLNGDVCDEGY